jgi:hypothetical protein
MDMPNQCAVERCERTVYGNGWCGLHYQRVRKHGEPGEAAARRGSYGGAPCQAADCDEPIYAKGWCSTHYDRVRRTGDVKEHVPITHKRRICSVEGCDRKHYGRGLCDRHWGVWKRSGEVRDPRPKGRKDRLDGRGYVLLYRPDHPNANDSGYVLGHRFAMAEQLGRQLEPDEQVHHRNGNRADNRPENLELWARSHPKSQRVEDLVAWAKEILARY